MCLNCASGVMKETNFFFLGFYHGVLGYNWFNIFMCWLCSWLLFVHFCTGLENVFCRMPVRWPSHQKSGCFFWFSSPRWDIQCSPIHGISSILCREQYWSCKTVGKHNLIRLYWILRRNFFFKHVIPFS